MDVKACASFSVEPGDQVHVAAVTAKSRSKIENRAHIGAEARCETRGASHRMSGVVRGFHCCCARLTDLQ
jgi:hypothetical protein